MQKITIILTFIFIIGLLGGLAVMSFNKKNLHMASSWSNIQADVLKDCKTRTLEYVKSDQGVQYKVDLMQSIKSDLSTIAPSGLTLAFRELGTTEDYCWVAWIGTSQGNGEIAYETKNNNIKKLKVISFPVFSKSALD